MNRICSNDDMKLDNISYLSETTTCETTYQPDSLSTDIELEEATEGSIDLREITQCILDMEETQASGPCLAACTMPSSPPPSYEHVLAETKIAEEAAAAAAAEIESISTLSLDDEDSSSQSLPRKGVEIVHKSHKEFYRAVAKQWGITCKMSDHCRCVNCQSMYFECEYDQNEHEKTDGGLGAGTPMFISEVMHGTACTIL